MNGVMLLRADTDKGDEETTDDWRIYECLVVAIRRRDEQERIDMMDS